MNNTRSGAPVVGFNHNVKYGPRVYHCQTEDSGLPHAHCITHLFVGGNIVASTKASYADRVDDPELQRIVRGLMEVQHKAMLRRLVSGEFNDLAERLSAPSYAPGVLADGSTGPEAVNTASAEPAAAAALQKPQARQVAPARTAPPPAARPAPAAKPPAAQPVWQPAPPSASPRLPGAPLPATTRGPAQPTRPAQPPRVAPVAAPAQRATAAKPAAKPPPPPPTFFSETPVEMPADDLPTLFAEELISEKSLDEVILAFLSADLEPPK